MKQKQKQCRKMNPSSHKNQSTQAMHGLKTMQKGRKLPLMKEKVKQRFLLNLGTVWPRFFKV